MTAFIAPPHRIPWYLRIGLRIAQRRSGRQLLPAQLLAWYPRAAIGAAAMEGLISHGDGAVDERTLKIIRLTVSSALGCPFCVGMNSQGWETCVSYEELIGIQARRPLDTFRTFSTRENLAMEYARALSATPVIVPTDIGDRLAEHFTPREIIVLATTIAQVNYWARLVPGLGCPAED